MMRRGLYGMPNRKGTKPRQYTADEPVFKPMPRPGFPSFNLIEGFLSLLPWLGLRRRRRERESQEQRSQSMKAKGR